VPGVAQIEGGFVFEGEAGQSTGRYRVERMEPSLSSEVRRADVGSGAQIASSGRSHRPG
jgi:hypothetical protein